MTLGEAVESLHFCLPNLKSQNQLVANRIENLLFSCRSQDNAMPKREDLSETAEASVSCDVPSKEIGEKTKAAANAEHCVFCRGLLVTWMCSRSRRVSGR